MNILLIADPHIPIPPIHYGGAERIVHLYAQELTRLGHRVGLMAAHGSRDYGGGMYAHRAPNNAYHSRARRKIEFQSHSLWTARDFDVVYNHGRFDYLRTLIAVGKPLLHHFHCPVDQAEINSTQERLGKGPAAFQFISKSQNSNLSIRFPSYIIPNPIDCQLYAQASGDGGYLVFLGLLTSAKGVDRAISVARATGKRLLIAGKIGDCDDDRSFFHDKVEPFVDGNLIRLVGMVNDSQKQELLGNAAALLFPIRGPEAFGLVMTEALACGTPVIATSCGPTPEVVHQGITGFLCNSEDEMSAAVSRIGEIDRHQCRHIAETHFDVRVIAPRVVDVLARLAFL